MDLVHGALTLTASEDGLSHFLEELCGPFCSFPKSNRKFKVH
jgi:hypothetical protein